MRVLLYTHSLVSDWNHGNAHFLRGIMGELQARGHSTLALEPAGGWSRRNLRGDQGSTAIDRFGNDFPDLRAATYDAGFDHAAAVDGADLVLVHEWTDPAIVAELGRVRRAGGRFTLLFHDTHHRGVSSAQAITDLALEDYDAILAFGETLRRRYLDRGWGRQVFTWHEAADTRHFFPRAASGLRRDLVWIGNWGDDERAAELDEFLIAPARRLALTGVVHGVRYPDAALARLRDTNLIYRGWIANADVPEAFARHLMTVHVPRRPYVQALPGIPTIRMFEALACGIPLVSAPWDDCEQLFRANVDYLTAATGEAMVRRMNDLRHDPAMAAELARNGLATIRSRHSCAHRVDELLGILERLDIRHDTPVAGSSVA